jgi:uncharacterized protein YutE (UPF0331/DUF86 family)
LVDHNVFERRLRKLEELLGELRSLAKLDRETYLADSVSKTLAERWLQLLVECSLDIAHHLIADFGWPSPSTYRETFQILAEHGVLKPELAKSLEGWAGFRNVLVHLYLDIDHEVVFDILSEELDQIEAFARAVAEAAESGPHEERS